MYNKPTVFWAACLGMLLFGIGLITLGSMAPDLKSKFQLDDLSIGTMFSILPFGILTGSLVFGPVCDRYGYKLMLTGACGAMFIGFEGIAWSTSGSLLNLLIFVFGIGAGIINGATNAVVSDISRGAEGANLSLLGVFFGIGALGMPFVTGALKGSFSSFQIVEVVGWLTLAVAFFYSIIRFPPAKSRPAGAKRKISDLLHRSFLYLIAFYLFFHGSVEAILNNWTTSYLTEHLGVEETRALFGLSLYVLGMTLMRLLIGSVLRQVKTSRLFAASLTLVAAGLLLIRFAESYGISVAGLILCGIGLAAGFPVMLGLAGSRFSQQSGTAFSIIFTIALLGNMLINYAMGALSKTYGIHQFSTVALIAFFFMTALTILIFRKSRPAPEVEELTTELAASE